MSESRIGVFKPVEARVSKDDFNQDWLKETITVNFPGANLNTTEIFKALKYKYERVRNGQTLVPEDPSMTPTLDYIFYVLGIGIESLHVAHYGEDTITSFGAYKAGLIPQRHPISKRTLDRVESFVKLNFTENLANLDK